MKRVFRTRLLHLMAVTLTGLAATLAGAERPSPGDLREKLDEVLASGYHLEVPPQVRLQDLVLRVLRRLSEQIGIMSEAGPLADLPVWAHWIIFGVCGLLVILLVAHMGMRLREVLTDRRPHDRGAQAAQEMADPRALAQEAERAVARREHSLALRLLYRAVLLRLDRVGLLDYDPSRTNWENVAALRSADDELRSAMTGLAHEVDDTVYGGSCATARSWERARHWAELVRRAEGAR